MKVRGWTRVEENGILVIMGWWKRDKRGRKRETKIKRKKERERGEKRGKCNNLLLNFWVAHLRINLCYEAHSNLVAHFHLFIPRKPQTSNRLRICRTFTQS